MKISKVIAAGFASVIFLTSCDKQNDNQVNSTDQTFMTQASISNNAEISAATLAASKATRAEVKAFAQFMLAEHPMAQADLKNLGSSVGFNVKDTIDPAHVTLMAQLNTLTGRRFDSMYIHSQVTDHQTTLTFFQTEIASGGHASVRSYATTYMPHIQAHLTRADSISRAFF
jgi:putative membrane protein